MYQHWIYLGEGVCHQRYELSEAYAQSHGGLDNPGTCASIGYTVSSGTDCVMFNSGQCLIQEKLYKKPTAAQALASNMNSMATNMQAEAKEMQAQHILVLLIWLTSIEDIKCF